MNKKLTLPKLKRLYIDKGESVPEIAKILKYSEHKINYWLAKHGIPKRSISEAIYLKNNPNGDPFQLQTPKDLEEAKLFGLGLGLYWGEGNKLNKNAVRLGNSNPALLKTFIRFLVKFFCIDIKDLKFHLHLFSDIDIDESYNYWMKELEIDRNQFYRPTITKTGKLGTYRNKSRYGVLTIYYGNTKLRNMLIDLLTNTS